MQKKSRAINWILFTCQCQLTNSYHELFYVLSNYILFILLCKFEFKLFNLAQLEHMYLELRVIYLKGATVT